MSFLISAIILKVAGFCTVRSTQATIVAMYGEQLLIAEILLQKLTRKPLFFRCPYLPSFINRNKEQLQYKDKSSLCLGPGICTTKLNP